MIDFIWRISIATLIIIGFFTAVIIFATIVNYIDNEKSARRSNNGVKVKFKDFKELYAIAPARYRLDFDCAMYFGPDKAMYIYFSILEHLLLYYNFRSAKLKAKNKCKNVERTRDYIDQVKKDLDQFISTPPHK